MSFENYPEVVFISSTKNDGNMSLRKQEPSQVIEQRTSFLEHHGILLENTTWSSLPHETGVVIATGKDRGKGSKDLDSYLEGDIILTNTPEVFLAIITGDCIPAGIYDPQTRSLALIHASIRNLPLGVFQVAVDALAKTYSSKAKDLVVEFGPSICPNCYKPLYLDKTLPELHGYLTKLSSEGYSFNLWKLAKDKLLAAGILETNIHNPEICAYHTGQYFSHRQSANERLDYDFRFATILGLKHG